MRVFIFDPHPFVHVIQGEPCSVCPTLGELPANLLPGVMAQTLQQKGEKGEPGIGEKGEQVGLCVLLLFWQGLMRF